MNRRPKQGYTLVELSVAMSVGSTLLILSISLIHQVMRYQSVTRNREVEHRLFDRLAGEFRRDVHRAKSANLISPNEIIFIYGDKTRTRFQTEEKRILKTRLNDGKIVQTESFEFARLITGEIRMTGDPAQISLSIHSPGSVIGTDLVPHRRFTATLSRLIDLQSGGFLDD